MPTNDRPLRSDLTLAALPTAAFWARRHAIDVINGWDLGDLADLVELLVSELVTNALNASVSVPCDVTAERHLHAVPPGARSRVRLRLSYARTRLRVEVWDGAERAPVTGVAGIADAEAEGGRGLMLVEALSLDWGWFQARRGGKVVWCELGAVRLAATAAGGVRKIDS